VRGCDYCVCLSGGDKTCKLQASIEKRQEQEQGRENQEGRAAEEATTEEGVHALGFKVGDLVEGYWPTEGAWFPGKIVGCSGGGGYDFEYDIDYDDGDQQQDVPSGQVRLQAGGREGATGGDSAKNSNAPSPNAPSSNAPSSNAPGYVPFFECEHECCRFKGGQVNRYRWRKTFQFDRHGKRKEMHVVDGAVDPASGTVIPARLFYRAHVLLVFMLVLY
jgi:hypothetical protein